MESWNKASAEERNSEPAARSLPHSTRYWTEPLRADMFVEMQLLLLTFSTGIQDAICFPDFHGFASNQTGNTVLLAVGLAGNSGVFNLTNIGLSLAAFIAGAIFTGQIGNPIGGTRRWWQFLVNIIQTAMIFGAAAIQHLHGVREIGPWPHFALGLLAASSGSQVASARAFRMTEISTAMATAAWVDLVIDPAILARSNRSRNRRSTFLIALVAGSFAGAYMQARIGSSLALFVSGIGKVLVTIAILLTRARSADAK
ncbi:hypothetical protein BAUCODRAFT_32643 [Baudoinia panamericana UAMH 10762]|uniref:DUF1275 domain protein n=1 Tax=Baudoinia panamericana (strain UAMH 10762) TaxID=717646 RepID=M2MZ59_BAUPA|nr:uncharacterized protein BAUCODRAFT_32643 [Baudoinia panamericana UAMH 10762]EMC96898.1 hypothetical protein BAUCODRAFT_32643 [Baudoinia panamericana UAMH 10762]